MADPQAELDAMVRDFCKIGPIPKSEARRRIQEYAEARNEALLQALKEFLENDGGDGSKCYDAYKYCAARKKLRKILDSGSASQEAKTGESAT